MSTNNTLKVSFPKIELPQPLGLASIAVQLGPPDDPPRALSNALALYLEAFAFLSEVRSEHEQIHTTKDFVKFVTRYGGPDLPRKFIPKTGLLLQPAGASDEVRSYLKEKGYRFGSSRTVLRNLREWCAAGGMGWFDEAERRKQTHVTAPTDTSSETSKGSNQLYIFFFGEEIGDKFQQEHKPGRWERRDAQGKSFWEIPVPSLQSFVEWKRWKKREGGIKSRLTAAQKKGDRKK
jgi:hypothetical protein